MHAHIHDDFSEASVSLLANRSWQGARAALGPALMTVLITPVPIAAHGYQWRIPGRLKR